MVNSEGKKGVPVVRRLVARDVVLLTGQTARVDCGIRRGETSQLLALAVGAARDGKRDKKSSGRKVVEKVSNAGCTWETSLTAGKMYLRWRGLMPGWPLGV